MNECFKFRKFFPKLGNSLPNSHHSIAQTQKTNKQTND